MVLLEVAHVTRDSDTTFKVKRSKVNLQGHIVAASRTACFAMTLCSLHPYTIYISYVYGTILPICAESAVKHQQTKSNLFFDERFDF